MARTIKSLRPKNKPRKKYKWNQWADGQAWSLTKGVDFTCTANVFRNYLNCVASRLGKRVTSRVNGNTVQFQFLERTTEES